MEVLRGLTGTGHWLTSACDGLKGYYVTDSCTTRTPDGCAAHAALRSGWLVMSAQQSSSVQAGARAENPAEEEGGGWGVFSNLKQQLFGPYRSAIQCVCVVPMNWLF